MRPSAERIFNVQKSKILSAAGLSISRKLDIECDHRESDPKLLVFALNPFWTPRTFLKGCSWQRGVIPLNYGRLKPQDLHLHNLFTLVRG